eukprot:4647462-Amphidinium_carterae.1
MVLRRCDLEQYMLNGTIPGVRSPSANIDGAQSFPRWQNSIKYAMTLATHLRRNHEDGEYGGGFCLVRESIYSTAVR